MEHKDDIPNQDPKIDLSTDNEQPEAIKSVLTGASATEKEQVNFESRIDLSELQEGNYANKRRD